MEVEKRSNGNGTVVEEEDEGRRTIFSSIVSEKSLCLSLFIISLGVVVAKLFINYGKDNLILYFPTIKQNFNSKVFEYLRKIVYLKIEKLSFVY